MKNKRGLVSNFVDIDRKRTARAGVLTTKLSYRILSLCDEHGLSQSISCIIRGKTKSGLVTLEALAHVFGLTLSEFLEGVTRDPEETLAQDWKAFTDEQLKAINRSLKEIAGEPTHEQMDAIVRSVMLPAA